MLDKLTSTLTNLGLTHDSAILLWGKILSIAALIASGALDLPYWATYLGLHVSVTEIHWAQAVAVAALYLSGQYSGSPLIKETK
jgi:hypothetical protein